MTSLIPRRDPLKNYFPMPNEIFGMGLCAGEIAVYAYLMYRENRKTYQCWPSYGTIGSALHMSSNTVRKYVRQLEEKGFIVTEHTKIRTQAGEARNGTLLYTLRPIREPVKQLRDRQWEDSKRELERVRVERLREKRKDTVFEIFSPSREGSGKGAGYRAGSPPDPHQPAEPTVSRNLRPSAPKKGVSEEVSDKGGKNDRK